MTQQNTISVFPLIKNSFKILWNNKAVALTYLAIMVFCKMLYPPFLITSPITPIKIIKILIIAIPCIYLAIALSAGALALLLSIVKKQNSPITLVLTYITKPLIVARYFCGMLLLAAVPVLIAAPIALPIYYHQSPIDPKLIALISLFGFIFMIIYWYYMIRFSFYYFFIIDKNTNVIESFKMSKKITENNVKTVIKTFLFFFLGLLIFTIPFAFFFIKPQFTATPAAILISSLINYSVTLVFFTTYTQLYLIFSEQKLQTT